MTKVVVIAHADETSYTTNALNQYDYIQNPRSLDVLVRSPQTVAVTSDESNSVGEISERGHRGIMFGVGPLVLMLIDCSDWVSDDGIWWDWCKRGP
jgi:hypothetical protein